MGASVTRCRTMASSTALRSRGFGIRTSAAPIATGKVMATVIPNEWKYGSAASCTSLPGSSPGNQATSCCTLQLRFRCVSIAPLETPVVPPV